MFEQKPLGNNNKPGFIKQPLGTNKAPLVAPPLIQNNDKLKKRMYKSINGEAYENESDAIIANKQEYEKMKNNVKPKKGFFSIFKSKR